MTNGPAPDAKLSALKVVSAARLLLGVSRNVPSKVRVSSETGAVRSPSQFSAVLQLSFAPPPSQIRSAASALHDAPKTAQSAALKSTVFGRIRAPDQRFPSLCEIVCVREPEQASATGFLRFCTVCLLGWVDVLALCSRF